MTLLVVGAGGHLGGEVSRRAVAAGQRVVGTYRRAAGAIGGVDWRQLDVRDGVAVRTLVRQVRPLAVVNTASVYGDWTVSADGSGYVALAAADAGARPEAVSRVGLGELAARHYRLDPAGMRTASIAESGLHRHRPAEIRLDSSRAADLLKTRLRGLSELFPA